MPAATPTRLLPEERAAVDAALRRVTDSGPWIGGPEVEAFEAEFGEHLGVRHVVGCANGTDALALALGGLDLAPGAAVPVPGHDGGYAATAARMAGFVPVAVDVDAQSAGPTVATVTAAAGAATAVGEPVAIVVTHLHGDPVDPVDLAAIDTWRRRRGMALIEDCAQAAGAPGTAAIGDAAAFSFYPTKNLGALGDAGAVGFTDASRAARARSLAQYGWGERYRIELPGGRNSRLDSLQAAVLRARLPFLTGRNDRRRAVRARYAAAAPQLELLGTAVGVAHHAVVRTDRRDALIAHLEERGVSTAIHYPVAVADMPGVGMPGLGMTGADTPEARRLAASIVSLPCTPELTDDEVDVVAAAVAEWAA
ncbi:MAG: DegT/DnrJ/EryC1/StrS family aminotransferase [Pseudolysinimonas sp.]